MTTASTSQFYLGTGIDVYEDILIPAIEAAEQEILFVTCFWARSPVLSKLGDSLILLSQKSLSRAPATKIRVRLCFSSRSLLQKFFHTASPNGYTYPPATWTTKLGLPAPGQLEGLDLQVKSLFFRPFSVMHPKFVVIDRRKAFMPSCNLSWEKWLECCISLDGPIVGKLVDFWCQTWERNDLPSLETNRRLSQHVTSGSLLSIEGLPERCPDRLPKSIFLAGSSTEALLLPSPHHTSISLSLPILTPPAPLTPLNVFLSHNFRNAKSSIKLITPNLTSPPVLNALLAALLRGVDVTIVTSKLMMIPEQLVTSGTMTEICLWKLARAHRRLRAQTKCRTPDEVDPLALEEGPVSQRLGNLKIEYFHSRCFSDCESRSERLHEPVKTHAKCAVFDQEIIVLGSGNMDRASWYTSQELGIALFGGELVASIWGLFIKGLRRRIRIYNNAESH